MIVPWNNSSEIKDKLIKYVEDIKQYYEIEVQSNLSIKDFKSLSEIIHKCEFVIIPYADRLDKDNYVEIGISLNLNKTVFININDIKFDKHTNPFGSFIYHKNIKIYDNTLVFFKHIYDHLAKISHKDLL